MFFVRKKRYYLTIHFIIYYRFCNFQMGNFKYITGIEKKQMVENCDSFLAIITNSDEIETAVWTECLKFLILSI